MRARTTKTALRLACILAIFHLGGAARAALHGGIEVGAKGVKATAVEVTGEADNRDLRVVMAATENTTLTAGLASSGRFAPEALKATAAAVARFADRMRKEHSVPAENIYVVGSSGLFSAVADDREKIKANRDALAAAVHDACGVTMTFIDVRREAELSIAGVVPRRHAADAVLVDVGGGNTKGGGRAGEGYVTFGVPYGSVSFADAVGKRGKGEKSAEAAAALRREALGPALHQALAGKPELTRRGRVYLSGGAVWAMATYTRPGHRGPYLPLTASDVAAYRKLLLDSPGEFPRADLSAVAEGPAREAAKKELDAVRKTFTPDQLLAGAEILQGLADEFRFGEKQLLFARHAYLGWLLAYVTEKGTAD
jgi:hypothetical protein